MRRGFCYHDFHQTTETDLQHMALGGDDYEYAVWEALNATTWPHAISWPSAELARKQKIVTDRAYALAVERDLIPYSEETFLSLMEEVEAEQHKRTEHG